MIIVVESGSTKADWMLIDQEITFSISTKGLNPLFHSKTEIIKELSKYEELNSIKNRSFNLYFYGAGCSSEKLKNQIKDDLGSFFVKANISIDNDLHAAAYACYQNRPQIACILGTGSNSCYYDGKEFTEKTPAIGYILGDEASGTYFGKRMLKDFLYHQLPLEIEVEFLKMGMDKNKIIDSVYRRPDANVFISSFMPLLIKYKELAYSKNIIFKGLQEFIDIHIKCYENYQNHEVNFVGSISELLKDELLEICDQNKLKTGIIIRRPLERLTQYHCNSLNQ